MELTELFWSASVEELAAGFVYRDGFYICLICGERFEDGAVYRDGESFYEARKYIGKHIAAEHGSAFDCLINLDKRDTGLSEIQKEYLRSAYQKRSDRETARAMGCSESTVRNHRFKLREKANQAKVFLAIHRLVERNAEEEGAGRLLPVPKSAAMVDLRYAVTEAESERILRTYFDEAGRLKEFPAKEKKKLVVLRQLGALFAPKREYTEKEVNRLLERVCDDYVTIRRELIEYGFLDRKNDGSCYWVRE
ncbi:hypothetical protein CAFE_17060 [Caprobacter fermentans]|uniref:HTH luxR-type domain-containing protein n=1 Tax=Caproicibacter fermentans TaxID=2576756 RepID=A0A6N8HYS5_9FIRM|nr:DUF2087 domain-containing protein [Caproicibacter fermentans]MVB11004.1 hypothetical protein [Caproicibacter fermentans]